MLIYMFEITNVEINKYKCIAVCYDVCMIYEKNLLFTEKEGKELE